MDKQSQSSAFLDFWKSKKIRPTEVPDPAYGLFTAYESLTSDLANLQNSTLAFLVPVKAKGAWVPGYDPSKIGELSALANRISEAEAKLESLCKAIEEFVSITKCYAVGPLVTERVNLHKGLAARRNGLKAAMKEATANGRLLPSEIASLPKIKELEQALAVETERVQPELDGLEKRISDARHIISDPYANVTTTN